MVGRPTNTAKRTRSQTAHIGCRLKGSSQHIWAATKPAMAAQSELGGEDLAARSVSLGKNTHFSKPCDGGNIPV